METINFLIAGVGGQGTVLASDIVATAGLSAGYDAKKSDILGLAVRGGAVVGHVRWGDKVQAPIVPEGRVDYFIAFEILEGLRWLNQVRPQGSVLVNQQAIHPVMVSSGLESYPDEETVSKSLKATTDNVIRVPGIDMALELGNARVLNVVLLGVLSGLLDTATEHWEQAITDRVPSKYTDLNIKAFHTGRQWMLNR